MYRHFKNLTKAIGNDTVDNCVEETQDLRKNGKKIMQYCTFTTMDQMSSVT